MRQNPWVRTLDYVIESCWLLALVAVPIFFDTLTVRIFEPDKIALFRNIVLVMAVALLLRAILAAPAAMARASAPPANGSAPTPTDGSAPTPAWHRFVARWPLAIPVVVFAVVYTIATVHSVLPGISFWGAYDRSQGLYTWLSYMAFFAIMAYSLRSWSQIERIVSALVFGSIPVSIYGIMQHMHWDPVAWGADTTVRVASTLGNAIFLGAYLLMCMPFVAYRLWQAIERLRAPEPVAAATTSNGRGGRRNRPRPKDTIEINGIPPIVSVAGYTFVLVVNFAAMYFNGSRGPYYGMLVAIVVLGILLTLKFANPNPAIFSIILAVVLYGVLYAINHIPSAIAMVIFLACIAAAIFLYVAPRTVRVRKAALLGVALVVGIIVFPQAVDVLNSSAVSSAADSAHLTDLGINGTSEVRTLIWRGSIPLIEHRPLLGWGPETMIYVYPPYYLAELGHVEHANAAPDRNHDVWLDFLVFSGIVGLLAWLALLAVFAYVVLTVLRRARSTQAGVIAAAVAAVVAGHLAEATVGIPIVSTLMLLWTMFAVATALFARRELIGEMPALAGLAASAPGVMLAGAAAGRATEPVLAGANTVAATVAAGTNGRNRNRGRDAGQRSQRAGESQRPPRGGEGQRGQRGTPRPAPAPARPSLDRLSGAQQGGLLALIVVTLVAIVGGFLLFANNVQVVRADAADKLGQAYDSTGTACIAYARNHNDPAGAACPYQAPQYQTQQIVTGAGQLMLTGINYYDEATSEQPNQEMYYLHLGKAYLDLVEYDQTEAQLSQAARQSNDVTTAFQDAEHALLIARALNPYNPDHAMNLGRLYHAWAGLDPSKWALMDHYFRIGTTLAPHNGRFSDEWGAADLQEAGRAGLTPTQRTALERQALSIFQHACNVDDQLGDARIYRAEAYQALGMYRQAVASYEDGLKIGNFEVTMSVDGIALPSATAAIEGLVTSLAQANDYAALVKPVNLGTTYGTQAPITVAYSPTLGLIGTSPFSTTLQSISTTLRTKGLVK